MAIGLILSGTLGSLRRPAPDPRRHLKAPQAQQLGTFKHCITKTSGNHHNVQRIDLDFDFD